MAAIIYAPNPVEVKNVTPDARWNAVTATRAPSSRCDGLVHAVMARGPRLRTIPGAGHLVQEDGPAAPFGFQQVWTDRRSRSDRA